MFKLYLIDQDHGGIGMKKDWRMTLEKKTALKPIWGKALIIVSGH